MSQYLGDLGCEHVVFKNDEKTVEEIASMNPRGILVSPGPGAIHLHQSACACVPRNCPGKRPSPRPQLTRSAFKQSLYPVDNIIRKCYGGIYIKTVHESVLAWLLQVSWSKGLKGLWSEVRRIHRCLPHINPMIADAFISSRLGLCQ